MSAGIAIGAAAAQSGVPAKTIRYYEQIGLLGPPTRGENQYRAYGAEDVAMLRFLGRARRLGFSIADLRGLVALYRDRDRTSREVKALASQHLARIDRKIAELQSVRGALAVLIRDCRGDHRPDCPIIDELSGAEAGRRRHPAEGRRAA